MTFNAHSPETTRPIYLDYQATTPCDPRVVEAMLPYFTEKFGNPHSRSHAYGWEAEHATETARKHIAQAIGCHPKDIVFTSGATEANNLAIKGVAQFLEQEKRHFVTCVTEHKCVLNSFRDLEQKGCEVTYLPVQPSGLIDLDQLDAALRGDTALVSIMAVGNEIGVIQPIAEIGRLCRTRGVFFHSDAAQALGRIPINVEDMQVDLMSFSSHKVYGPKGVGALYVRRSKPRVRLHGLFSGGGQERGMRSGTLPTPLCVGFGQAVLLAEQERESEWTRLNVLKEWFYQTITQGLSDVYLNGDWNARIPGNINMSFAYVEGESLMMALKDLAISSGSACTSESLEPSYVLRALGVDEDLAHTSLRIGMGRFTTRQDIEYAAKRIIEAVQRLRAMSPLWEMVQQGIDLKSIQWDAH